MIATVMVCRFPEHGAKARGRRGKACLQMIWLENGASLESLSCSNAEHFFSMLPSISR